MYLTFRRKLDKKKEATFELDLLQHLIRSPWPMIPSFRKYWEHIFPIILLIKGGVCHFGETSSSALEFENTQPEKICPFLQTSLQSPSSNTHERAHDQ